MYDFVFILDANQRVGAGHLVRALALVEYFVSGGQEIAFVGDIDAQMFNTIVKQNIRLYGSSARPECRCLIVDHYAPLEEVLDAWPISLPVILFEDLSSRESERPVMVVNALGNNEELKASFPNAEIACGLNFQLYRQAVRSLCPLQKGLPKRQNVADSKVRILINFGGSDQSVLIKQVLAVIHRYILPKTTIDVVGECNLPQELASNVKYHGPFIDDFLSRARASDIVICGAGQTLLEMLYLECFTIGLVIAENQLRCAQIVGSLGYPVVTDLSALESSLMSIFDSTFHSGNVNEGQFNKPTVLDRQVCAESKIGSGAELLVRKILACKS